MIHDLIDQKRKPVGGGASRNPRGLPEGCDLEQSDVENKDADASATFIPPWLRNSLGLSQRNKQSHAVSDPKSGRVVPRDAEGQRSEWGTPKGNVGHDCCQPKGSPTHATVGRASECQVSRPSKALPLLWNSSRRESETESKYANPDVASEREGRRLMEEDRTKWKVNRERNRFKRRLQLDQKATDARKNDADFLLELKAREVLENYVKKEVHSVSSDMKHLEAKLILLGTRSHQVDSSKLTSRELELLEGISVQTTNKEDFERFVDRVREVNLRKILKNPDGLTKAAEGNARKSDEGTDYSPRHVFQASGRDRDREKIVSASTDDEDDVKRFSEFLSKNKNQEEKRKCLEEVRNYFERKRRTRLSRKRYEEEGMTPSLPTQNSPEKKEEPSKERQRPGNLFNQAFSKNKKSKRRFYDLDIMEKAVNETLQRFIDLYHFRVSPSVITGMRKKILHAIKEPSAPRRPPSANQKTKEEPERQQTTNEEDSVPEDARRSKSQINLYPCFAENAAFKVVPESASVEDAKTTPRSRTESPAKSERNDRVRKVESAAENENIRRLKREFESFLDSIPAHALVKGLKLHSVSLEKEENPASKNLQFVYNFTKKMLDAKGCEKADAAKEGREQKKAKEKAAQTEDRPPTREQSLQTESDANASRLRELEGLRGFNINPGLYRMVRSNEAGKFYLYPEKLEERQSSVRGEKSSSLNVLEHRKALKKRESKKLSSKGRRVSLEGGDRGAPRKNSEGRIAADQVEGKSSATGRLPEADAAEGISCLYFRNSEEHLTDSTSKKEGETSCDEEGQAKAGEGAEAGIKETTDSGSLWLWNGEKIAPGCDLKTHVEDLLREKLKEIASCDAQSICHPNNSINSLRRVAPSKPSEKNVHGKGKNAVFGVGGCGRDQEKTRAAEVKSHKKSGQKDEKAASGAVPTGLGKVVKDAATQNSRQRFLSVNIASGRPRRGKRRRKKGFAVNAPSGTHKDHRDSLKRAANIVRAIRELKKAKGEDETFEAPPARPSTEEGTYSSSSRSSFLFDDSTDEAALPTPVPVYRSESWEPAPGNKKRNAVEGGGEAGTDDAYDEDEASAESPKALLEDGRRHWELIESLLDGSDRGARQNPWDDVRNLVRKKIGRDINDDGAREVCIEIEQDLTREEQGNGRQAVMARGHYSKKEGDVEVEIDLTLDDLKRILRHRHRQRFRRRRARRRVSSSSGQSDLIAGDRRIRRCGDSPRGKTRARSGRTNASPQAD